MTDTTQIVVQALVPRVSGTVCDIQAVSSDIANELAIDRREVEKIARAFCTANGIEEPAKFNVFQGPRPPNNVPEGAVWADTTTPGVIRVLVSGEWMVV